MKNTELVHDRELDTTMLSGAGIARLEGESAFELSGSRPGRLVLERGRDRDMINVSATKWMVTGQPSAIPKTTEPITPAGLGMPSSRCANPDGAAVLWPCPTPWRRRSAETPS